MTSLEQIAAHPRCNDLARLTRAVLFDAAGASIEDLRETVAERAGSMGLTREETETPHGNALDALAHPASDPAASALVGTLLAYAIALDSSGAGEDAGITATKLTWLGAQGVDALSTLDEAMGDRASTMWTAVGDLLERHDADGSGITRPEAIVAAMALGTSKNECAVARVRQLQDKLRVPMLSNLVGRAVATPGASADVPALTGQLAPPPHSTVATVLLAVSGWMLLGHLARLVGRFALKLRRPAEVSVTPQGIRIKASTILLGKVMRDSETLIPFDSLVRATREVRFPRTGTYAGLVALALGSYLGVSWFVDGVRAASFSLAAVGILVVVLGVALDFVFMSLLPGRRAQCRVVFVPKRGSATCVGWVDVAQADTFLRGIARK